MHSSRVFRSEKSQTLKRIRFQEFGADGEVIDEGLLIDEESFCEASQPPSVQGTPLTETHSLPPNTGKQIEEAYLQGKEEGQQEIRLQFENSLELFARGIEEIGRLRSTLLQNSAQDMLRLVLSIARQVIHCEVSLNRELVLTTIEKALRAAVRCDHYHIKVHPDDLALVTEQKPLFVTSINGLENITVEGDPQIVRGGCLLESELGMVDATVDGQLEEIRRTLLSTVEQN